MNEPTDRRTENPKLNERHKRSGLFVRSMDGKQQQQQEQQTFIKIKLKQAFFMNERTSE